MGRCMTDTPPRKASKSAPPDRESRLKSALKANLARRKAQTRARTAGEAGQTESDRGEEQEEQKD